MRRLAPVVAAVALLVALVAPGPASAHPLGNFTVNRFAAIELAGSKVYVRYALDLAEIPTFQTGDDVRKPAFAARLASNLELSLDGRRVPLRVVSRRASQRPGAGGLPTMRFDAVFEALGEGTSLSFADRSYPGRIGWREIVVRARDGARVIETTASRESRSDELRAYPRDQLRSPPDERTATVTFSPGPAPADPPALEKSPGAEHAGGGFESLIARDRLSLGVVLASLLAAAFWGAAHALTPGHGKALVAGYLVGARGRPRDAVLLGATVTVAHTAGVFALGLVTLGLSRFVVPERLYPWLTLASGLLVVCVGASVLLRRLRPRRDHDHDHGHGHGGHHHQDHEAPTRRGILGVGVAAGVLPCPSALVVLLSALALHRLGFGLALLVAFSLGLAATITGIGLLAVLARSAFGRVALDGPLIRALPAASALVILGLGIAITVRAIPGLV